MRFRCHPEFVRRAGPRLGYGCGAIRDRRKARRNIQFPFSKTQAPLREAARNRLAHKVSDKFRDTILGLKPHGETGGNKLPYFMSAINKSDMHATLIPAVYNI